MPSTTSSAVFGTAISVRGRSSKTTLSARTPHRSPTCKPATNSRSRCGSQLDIFNLFNTKDSDIDYYYASRLPGEPSAGVDDIHFHPALPRTARLSLHVAF